MIVLIGNEKGGPGKTTVAVNLSALCAMAGRETILVDTDRQESASTWATTRAMTRSDKKLPVDLTCVTKTGRVGYDLDKLRAKYEIVIVDAGGKDSGELRQAMVVCDTMVIPVRPSQFDTWSLNKMGLLIQDVEERISIKIPTKVLLNAVSSNPGVKEADELRTLLSGEYASSFGLMTAQLTERIAYRRAAREGLCVAELVKPYADPVAVEEMKRLYMELFNVNWSAAQKPSVTVGLSQ